MMRKFLALLILLMLQLNVAYTQCHITTVDAAALCPGGDPVTVTIDISEGPLDCFDAGQNTYAETMVFDFSGAGYEFVPGSVVLNTGTGDINDGGAAFISTETANQIIVGGLGTNNGGGGRNAIDQITLSVDVITTGLVAPAYIRRNGGSFLINAGIEPVNTEALVNLTSSQMTYTSTSVDQVSTNVSQNTTNAEILRIPIVVADDGCPFTMESLDLQYSGTSLLDISSVKIYYSGTNPAFDPNSDILFGARNSPPAAFTISGSQELVDGTNYFWAVVDVPFTATVANQIDLDLISYQYDDSGTPITRSNGVDFAGGPAGARTITAFTGTTITVGTAARNFTTLQAAYDAVPANLANNYIIELYVDYNDALETFPVTFAQKAAYNGNIILIRPALGQTGIRVGGDPGGNNPLINFNGADYVTIDGRPNSTISSRELRFVNFNSTATAFSVFSFTNGATNNKLEYIDIEGEADASLTGLVDFEFSSGGVANNNNVIANNFLSDIIVGGSAKTPGVGIYSLGDAGTPNENNTIENNEFVDIWDGSNFDSWCIQLSTGTNNWSINGNSFYQSADYSSCDFNSGFIQVGDGGDYDIIGNNFGSKSADLSVGTFVISSGTAPFDCIYFLAGSGGGDNRYLSNTLNRFEYTTSTVDPFPALTFFYNEGSSDFVIGSADGPNVFGNQTTTQEIRLNCIGGPGSSGISGITNNGTGSMALNHNSFGSIKVEGSDGMTTILADNLIGEMSVENCTFGGSPASSIEIDSDSRLELVSNTTVSGIDVNSNTFQNVRHNATTEPFYAIYNLDGNLSADDNTFTNFISNANVEFRVINHIANGATITNNSFENIAVNSNGGSAALVAIYSNTTGDAVISDNTIGNTTPSNLYVAGDDASYGIYQFGAGTFTCERNTVQGLEMDNGGVAVRFYGIYNAGSDLIADENVISTHTIQSTSTLTAFYGIYCTAAGNNHVISDNLIEECAVDNGTTPISTSIEGIYISSNDATTERNTIRGLYNSGSSQSSEIIGINNAFGPNMIRNNVVLLDNSLTVNSVSIKGIVDNDGAGTVRVVHNTISIDGNSVGTSTSAAYVRNADGNDMVANNIFQNNRAGASGPDYCIEAPFTAGTFSSENNFFENIDNSQMFSWGGGPEDLPTFQGSTGGTNTFSQVGVEAIDNDGRTTPAFIMADGGADLFTATIVVDDKDLAPRDVNPWPGAYEGAAVSLGPNYYVNDGLTAADEFCTAAGADGVGCGTISSPCATVQYVHDNYVLNGDTIFVDDGGYTETDITISQPLVVYGATTSPLFLGNGTLDTIRAFDITVQDVTLNRLRISSYKTYNKTDATNLNGGAIRIKDVIGTTTLSNLLIDGCFAQMGGAISIEQNVPGISDVKISGSTLSLDSALTSGGAISADLVANGGIDLAIVGSNIGNVGLRNGAQQNGGGIYFNGSNLYISNSLLTENNAFGAAVTNGGGAIYVENGAVVLDTCFLLTNTGERGGAIYVNSGSLTIDSASINENSATVNGGAIFVDNTSVVDIKRANFGTAAFPNTAANGGAIYVDGGTLDLSNTIFLNNTASSNGGALNVRSEANITGCAFSTNSANNGGAILGDISSRVNIDSTFFIQNNAVNSGGVLYSNLNSDVSIDNSFLGFSALGNTANNGAGVYFAGDSIVVNNTDLGYNIAGDRGGNMFIAAGKLLASNSDFIGANAGNKGGSFYIGTAGIVGLDSCVIDSNSSVIGGAIQLEGDSVYITNSQINNNFAQDEGAIAYIDLGSYFSADKCDLNFNSNIGNSKEGGGIHINDAISLLELDQCIMTGNLGDDRGIITSNSDVNITNTLFYENTVEKEGVIVAYNTAIINLMNVTSTDNISNTAHAGLELRNNSQSNVTNSIFWNNTNMDLNEQGGGAILNVDNSIYGTINVTNGVLSNSYNSDPLFTSSAVDDYTITNTSPAVDGGTLVGAPSVDLVDTIRPKGAGIDIGAYESDFVGCDTATVASLHTWTGAVSNDWFDCGNWDTGTLPNSNCDVIIPGGTLFNPLITAQTGYCKTIQINVPGGALLTLDTPGSGVLEITP